MSRPFSFLKTFQLSVKVKSTSECFVFTGIRVSPRFWGQGPEVLLFSPMFPLKKGADLGVIFFGSVRVRHPGKMAISAKERASRNLPLSTKGG